MCIFKGKEEGLAHSRMLQPTFISQCPPLATVLAQLPSIVAEDITPKKVDTNDEGKRICLKAIVNVRRNLKIIVMAKAMYMMVVVGLILGRVEGKGKRTRNTKTTRRLVMSPMARLCQCNHCCAVLIVYTVRLSIGEKRR